jgi:hypothetical protein
MGMGTLFVLILIQKNIHAPMCESVLNERRNFFIYSIIASQPSRLVIKMRIESVLISSHM